MTRLGELAAAIAQHPMLGSSLALKGGSALNLCLRDAPTRMSVDLDYNYVTHTEREKMLTDRPKIEAAVEEITRRLGYRVQRSADAVAGRKLDATYRSVLGMADRVELDLNFLFRAPLDGVREVEMWQPGELDRPRIHIVSVMELCIGKFLALLDRAAPRDAWDAIRLPLLAGDVLQSAEFRACFVAMSVILDHPVFTYTRSRLAVRLTVEVIESQLVPMIAAGSKPDPTTLVDDAWRVVGPFVDLRPNEMAYVEAVGHGELQPELLFPNDRHRASSIASHPAIRWKVENVNRRRDEIV